MYHGVNGVALFLLYAVKKTNNSHIKDIFEKIYRYNLSLALRELEINEFKELSLFEGPSSFIYLHLTMHKVFHIPLDNYLIGKFENWLLICFEKDKNLDFLTGISGIVGFVISNKSYFSDHFISNIIDRYIHKVEETMNYDSQTETVYWNHIKEFDGQAGLSHGVGGYLFTLSGIFSYKKDEKILKMIIASYNYIKSMNLNSKDGFAYFDRKKDSLVTSGWTHGASGTIYSLLKAYSCVQKNYLPGIVEISLKLTTPFRFKLTTYSA